MIAVPIGPKPIGPTPGTKCTSEVTTPARSPRDPMRGMRKLTSDFMLTIG